MAADVSPMRRRGSDGSRATGAEPLMSLRCAGEEATALARQVLFDLALTHREELEGVRAHRRVHKTRVRGDGGEPSGSQRLLDARGRQRVDERAGVSCKQPALTAVLPG